MTADLHMAEDIKATGKGRLLVVFDVTEIEFLDALVSQVQIEGKGVDVFDPKIGEVRSDRAESMACWFIDTDYKEESFSLSVMPTSFAPTTHTRRSRQRSRQRSTKGLGQQVHTKMPLPF